MKTLDRGALCENVTAKIVFGSKYAHALARLEVQGRELIDRVFTGGDSDMAKDRAKGEVRVGSLEWALFLSDIREAQR